MAETNPSRTLTARSIIAALATVAFVGCCVFVISTDSSRGQELIRAPLHINDGTIVPKGDSAIYKEAKEAGREAEAPKDFVDPSVPPSYDGEVSVDTSVTGSADSAESPGSPGASGSPSLEEPALVKDPVSGKPVPRWPTPVSKLEENCMIAKAFAYANADKLFESNHLELGESFQLLKSLAPEPRTNDNMIPSGCVAQWNDFVAKASKRSTTDPVAKSQLAAIEDSMSEGSGILAIFIRHEGDTKGQKAWFISGPKVGLADEDALHELDIGATITALQSEMNDMKSEYVGHITTAEAIKMATDGAPEEKWSEEDKKIGSHWDGSLVQ